MRILYIQCGMGAAGDMLMSSLIELIENQEEFLENLNNIGLDKIKIEKKIETRCGIVGSHIKVEVNGIEEHSYDYDKLDNHVHKHEHEHSHLHTSINDINSIINSLNISDKVKKDAISIYNIIANAEAKVHNKTVDNIHFHEVGQLDAIVDIIGVSMLMEQINPDMVISSPINTGSGYVKCAHGILPVPAPATAHILKDIPIYNNNIQGELCTPTGAAILKYFVNKFSDMPVMEIKKTGYGMGTKEFEIANCVRAFIGETFEKNNEEVDNIVKLSCNLDDMTGEEIAFAMEILMKNNALDVFTIPIYMKKNRPAQILVCICKPLDTDKLARLILKYTTTFGVRKEFCSRYKMEVEFEEVKTKYGLVHKKIGKGYNIQKFKYEYDDLYKIALEQDVSIKYLKDNI